MGGPIVRTGTTPEFWKNWDQVFGEKKNSRSTKKKAGGKKTVTAKKTAKKTKKKAKKKT